MDEDMQIYYNSVMLNLEQAAKTNRFATKEEYNKYIERLKKNGIPESMLSEEKKKELLDSYDEYHKVDEAGLDIKGYKGTRLDEQNYIAATEEDALLKTNANKNDLADEFKNVQNELASAQSKDDLANAKEVYQEMRDNKKEEISLITLQEMIERNNASEELLSKIRFFLTNSYVNPYEYKISPETGLFYHTENDEVIEVRKNPETGKYEIIRDSEAIYQDKEDFEQKMEEMPQEEFEPAMEDELEQEKTDIKRRRRLPPKDIYGQAAFVKSSILITICILISYVLSILIVLLKK